jgi:hypothetical protein
MASIKDELFHPATSWMEKKKLTYMVEELGYPMERWEIPSGFMSQRPEDMPTFKQWIKNEVLSIEQAERAALATQDSRFVTYEAHLYAQLAPAIVAQYGGNKLAIVRRITEFVNLIIDIQAAELVKGRKEYWESMIKNQDNDKTTDH